MRFGCCTKFARISCSVVQRIMQDHLASSVYKHRLSCSNSDHSRDPCHKSTNPIQFNGKTKFQPDGGTQMEHWRKTMNLFLKCHPQSIAKENHEQFLSLSPSCDQLEYRTRDFTGNHNISGRKTEGTLSCDDLDKARGVALGVVPCYLPRVQ